MNPTENSSNSLTDIESETDSENEQIVEKIVKKKMKFVEEKPNAEETIRPKTKLPNAEDVVQPKRMKKELPDAEDIVEKTEPTKTGKDFAKLTKKAITLGAIALNYSNRKKY